MRSEYHVDENGCWIWQKCRNNRGYGLKWDRATRRLTVAHRWYYERARGPIPKGLQIDHLCNVKACVNVAHLEAVTPQVNTQRAFALREKAPSRFASGPWSARSILASASCGRGAATGTATARPGSTGNG